MPRGDPCNGAERGTLLETIARVRDEVAAMIDRALAGARTPADLEDLLGALDSLVVREKEAGAPDRPPPACAAGCASCCTVNVGTLGAEGAVAAAWLRERRTPAEAAALASRLADFHDRVRWLEDRERMAARARCPLLDDRDRCSIHPVRPLACRAVSSLSAEDCRRATGGGDEEGPSLVRMDLLQKALYEVAFSALAEGLARRGLDARPRDVSGMTAAFLADGSLLPAYLAGARLPLE